VTLELESHCACGAMITLKASDLNGGTSLEKLFNEWRVQHTVCASESIQAIAR
jgi:hypothetical protein